MSDRSRRTRADGSVVWSVRVPMEESFYEECKDIANEEGAAVDSVLRAAMQIGVEVMAQEYARQYEGEDNSVAGIRKVIFSDPRLTNYQRPKEFRKDKKTNSNKEDV